MREMTKAVYIRAKLADAAVAAVAVLAGAVVVYIGNRLLGVRLELFYGVSTFTPSWVLALFFVPFVAGIFVSLIYGLGGKILAHFSPLIVLVTSYYQLHQNPLMAEQGVLLPIGYWLFIVIVAVEFASVGGVVGEILVKKTYGRTGTRNLHKLHRKHRKPEEDAPLSGGTGRGR